jgi:hypothetical protein
VLQRPGCAGLDAPLQCCEAPIMTEETRALTKRWVDTWKLAGPELQRQRDADARRADTIRAFAFFAGMPLHNLKTFPPEPTSGLVEQQRWFQKIARR